MLELIGRIERAIWETFSSDSDVEAYIGRWHEDDGNHWENFRIWRGNGGGVDLAATLRDIEDDELLFKIAVDMGIEVPGLVYSIPEIRGLLSSSYETAAATFEKAWKKVVDEPATSVCCANSALESIVKHICQNDAIGCCDPNDTLYDLVQHILREFKYYPCRDVEEGIRNIGSGLLKVVQNIEAMRSKHADTSHGKTSDDYIIDDGLYAKFILNAVTTVGLFMLNFYEKKYLVAQANQSFTDGEIPF